MMMGSWCVVLYYYPSVEERGKRKEEKEEGRREKKRSLFLAEKPEKCTEEQKNPIPAIYHPNPSWGRVQKEDIKGKR